MATPSTANADAQANTLKDEGNRLLASGDVDGALSCYKRAVALSPENHVLHSNLSAALAKKEDFKGALASAEQCVKLNPKWAKGYVRLGQSLLFVGRFADAAAAFGKGLAIEPTNATLKQGQADALAAAADAKANGQAETPVVDKDVVIGIDLGTTYSCVGVWEHGAVTIIPDSEGHRTTPSVVSFATSPSGEGVDRVVGHDAKRRITQNPSGTVYDIKRIIGQRFKDEAVKRDVGKFSYKVVNDEASGKPVVSVPAVDHNMTPEEISSMILVHMKKIAESYIGSEVKRAIVTVPAYFSDAQRQATKDAGAIAGLNVLRVINEPTAAALAYGLDAKRIESGDGKKVLIFDLGGGTFDVSILSIESGVFEVCATGGDTHLGGEDFDNAVVEWLMAQIKSKHPKEFEALQKGENADPQKLKAKLRTLAEQAKIQVSAGAQHKIQLEGLGIEGTLDFSRALFDKLNEEPFERCMTTVKNVVRDAKLQTEDIGDVVLVGGSTRIPAIRERLRDMFGGKQLCQAINPDEAVAYGAAVQGAIMNGGLTTSSGLLSSIGQDLVLVDVTPLSLGIECTGKIFSTVIPRNSSLPCERSKVYSTEEDYQTEIDVRVYEGERKSVDACNLLGEFRIQGIERAKRGVPQVEVTFSVSTDGILRVTARDQKTGATGNVAIAANSGRLSPEQIAKMVADAEKFKRADELREQRVNAVNELEHLIAEMDVSGSNKSRKAKEAAMAWLDENRDTANVRTLQTKIENIAAGEGI